MLKKNNSTILLKKPKSIIFDTDNTLYEYEPANKLALEAVALKVNNLLGINKESFINNYNVARNEVKKQLGNTASSHSRLLYFQKMLENLELKAQLLIALDLEQTFWRTFLANAPLFPGVYELFEKLTFNNISIAILTDLTAQVQLRKLTYFNLEDTFEAVVTSEETGADKPNKRNFELVLSKLGLGQGNQNWVVGDDPYTDIIGGKSIKAITFQKVHKGTKEYDEYSIPDFTFTNFKDLENLIDTLI